MVVNFTLIVVRSGKEHASPPSICDVKCLLDLSYLLFEVLFSVQFAHPLDALDLVLCALDFVRGTVQAGLVHMCDFFTTFAAQAGVDPSDGAWAPVDGLDLSALLVTGANATSPRTRIVHQHDMYNKSAGAVGALRDGDWKLIVGTEKTYAGWFGTDSADHFSPPESGALNTSDACSASRPCLFNIAEDAQERNDLASSRPDKVAELLAIFHTYDSEHHPSPDAPATDAAGCCAASKANGGYLTPWKA